jgi:hypothetical protein
MLFKPRLKSWPLQLTKLIQSLLFFHTIVTNDPCIITLVAFFSNVFNVVMIAMVEHVFACINDEHCFNF